MIFEIWLSGSVAATVCCGLDYELRDKPFDADSMWACIILSWIIVGAYAGQVIAKRMKRAAQAIEARRAETENTDSVNEGAVPEGNAP